MSIEELYVKHVYNTIAKEFSDTRYRPWTCVEEFLDGVEENSYIGDIGCDFNLAYMKTSYLVNMIKN